MPSISRRDFLKGVTLAVAAGLTPAAHIAAEPLRYPPALTGLRGQHAGSFETAHAQAREGKRFALDRLPVEERYDLVVVGAGISGLAAAAFYRRAAGPSARILVLDNHDDFGGHAKRNEFTLDGRLVIGYGGSESIDSPRPGTATVQKVFFATSASRSSGSRPLSSARSTPRSGCLAGCSLRARPSGATCWSRANRRAGPPTNAHAVSPTPSRSPSSWPRSRSRRRARHSCSRSTT